MNLFTLIFFFPLVGISTVFMLYLIILGMAPGVKPLEFTGFFLYGPGPGFFLLIAWLILALLLQIFAWVLRNSQQTSASVLVNRISWITLLLLLILEAVMLADFYDLF
jgi:hypothetical protein